MPILKVTITNSTGQVAGTYDLECVDRPGIDVEALDTRYTINLIRAHSERHRFISDFEVPPTLSLERLNFDLSDLATFWRKNEGLTPVFSWGKSRQRSDAVQKSSRRTPRVLKLFICMDGTVKGPRLGLLRRTLRLRRLRWMLGRLCSAQFRWGGIQAESRFSLSVEERS